MKKNHPRETKEFFVGALLTVISGPSGVGKDTIINELVLRHGYVKAVSFTTRNPRLGEKDGVDYHFISEGGVSRNGEKGRAP